MQGIPGCGGRAALSPARPGPSRGLTPAAALPGSPGSASRPWQQRSRRPPGAHGGLLPRARRPEQPRSRRRRPRLCLCGGRRQRGREPGWPEPPERGHRRPPPRPCPLTVGADGVVGVAGGGRRGRLPVVHPAEPLYAVVLGAGLVLHRHHGEVRHGWRGGEGSPRHRGEAGGTRRGAGGAFLPRAVTSSQETALLNSTHSSASAGAVRIPPPPGPPGEHRARGRGSLRRANALSRGGAEEGPEAARPARRRGSLPPAFIVTGAGPGGGGSGAGPGGRPPPAALPCGRCRAASRRKFPLRRARGCLPRRRYPRIAPA